MSAEKKLFCASLLKVIMSLSHIDVIYAEPEFLYYCTEVLGFPEVDYDEARNLMLEYVPQIE